MIRTKLVDGQIQLSVEQLCLLGWTADQEIEICVKDVKWGKGMNIQPVVLQDGFIMCKEFYQTIGDDIAFITLSPLPSEEGEKEDFVFRMFACKSPFPSGPYIGAPDWTKLRWEPVIDWLPLMELEKGPGGFLLSNEFFHRYQPGTFKIQIARINKHKEVSNERTSS